jgi:hypothetical protein
VRELTALAWESFFVKDYVKSLKTSVGSRITDPELITRVVDEMKQFRGEIEGGICVRRVEDFITESERRYSVLNGILHSGQSLDEIPAVVLECARRIPSKFFSVDVVQRRDGIIRVVEIGDGQVSDLVGWSVDAFVEMWLRSMQ